MKNSYEAMMEKIHAPEALQKRVLQAVKAEQPVKKKMPLLRLAACAAAALVLMLGTLRIVPASQQQTANRETTASAVNFSFGLTAYAAGSGDGLAFARAESEMHYMMKVCDLYEDGEYTDYSFQIGGEGIQTVRLSIDKGDLYRYAAGAYQLLGQQWEEPFDPEASYGFWIPQEALDGNTGLHVFDGAALNVQAVCEDGTVIAKSYGLSAEGMKQFRNEDGTQVLVPVLSGDQVLYSGLYAVPADSRFFQWPVQACKTVRLSNPFGEMGGQQNAAKGAFHAGIDIPAEAGSAVTAPMDGTVTAAGFDPQEGRYLTIDHGDGLTTTYAHCRTLEAQPGDTVKTGAVIATVGSTGMSTGAHLCFQVRQDGVAVNPVSYFDAQIRNQLHAE